MENANFKILDYLVPNCLPVFFFSCSECINYAVIFGSKRKRTYKSKQPYLDDGDLNGWYRFQGQEGTKMATSCVPFKRCPADPAGSKVAYQTLSPVRRTFVFLGSRCTQPLTLRNAHALRYEFSKWRTSQRKKKNKATLQ